MLDVSYALEFLKYFLVIWTYTLNYADIFGSWGKEGRY